MSILTEEEIEAIRESTCQEFMAALREQGRGKYDPTTFSRAIESAVLAKLAGMDLPQHYALIGKEERVVTETFVMEGTHYEKVYTAAQLHQAFAQGAASQLSAEPSAWVLTNGDVTKWEGEKVAHDFRNHDKAEPLYTLKEPK